MKRNGQVPDRPGWVDRRSRRARWRDSVTAGRRSRLFGEDDDAILERRGEAGASPREARSGHDLIHAPRARRRGLPGLRRLKPPDGPILGASGIAPQREYVLESVTASIARHKIPETSTSPTVAK